MLVARATSAIVLFTGLVLAASTPGPVGSICTLDSDCASGTCLCTAISTTSAGGTLSTSGAFARVGAALVASSVSRELGLCLVGSELIGFSLGSDQICRCAAAPTFIPSPPPSHSPTLLYLETFLHLDATCYLNSNVTAILPSARRRQSTGQAPAGRGTAGDSAASGEGAPAAGRGSASSTTASGQEAPAGGRGSASSSTASGQEAPAGGRGSASGGGEQGSSGSEAGSIERGKGPIGNGPLAQGDYSYDGCGKKIALRQIPSATHLRNWLAIAARASDIWFVTLPPSGSIKDAPMSLIANLTSAVKVTGHTEFHDWAADPTGAGLKTSDARIHSNFAELSASGDRRLIGTHLSFDFLPTTVVKTPEGQQPCKVVLLVREPKDNLVSWAQYFEKKYSVPLADALKSFVQAHSNAAIGAGLDELGVPNRGYVAASNGYATAVGKEGGPDVFLLSQSRLASKATVAAEIARLAAFLRVEPYREDPSLVADIQERVAAGLVDVSLMDNTDQDLVDSNFVLDPQITALY